MDISAFQAPAPEDGGGEPPSLVDLLDDDLRPAVLALLAVIKHVVQLVVLAAALFLCAVLYIFVLSWTCLFWLQTRLFFLTSITLRSCMEKPPTEQRIGSNGGHSGARRETPDGSTKGKDPVPLTPPDEKIRDSTNSGEPPIQQSCSSSEVTGVDDVAPREQDQWPLQDDSEPSRNAWQESSHKAGAQPYKQPDDKNSTVDDARDVAHERPDSRPSTGEGYRSARSTDNEDRLTQLNARLNDRTLPPVNFTVGSSEPEPEHSPVPLNTTLSPAPPSPAWKSKRNIIDHNDAKNIMGPEDQGQERASQEMDQPATRKPLGFTADQLAEARRFAMDATPGGGQKAYRGRAPQRHTQKQQTPSFQNLVNKPTVPSNSQRAQSVMLHTTTKSAVAPSTAAKKPEPGMLPPHKRKALEGKAKRVKEEIPTVTGSISTTTSPVAKLPPITSSPSVMSSTLGENDSMVTLEPSVNNASRTVFSEVQKSSIEPAPPAFPLSNQLIIESKQDRLVQTASKGKTERLDFYNEAPSLGNSSRVLLSVDEIKSFNTLPTRHTHSVETLSSGQIFQCMKCDRWEVNDDHSELCVPCMAVIDRIDDAKRIITGTEVENCSKCGSSEHFEQQCNSCQDCEHSKGHLCDEHATTTVKWNCSAQPLSDVSNRSSLYLSPTGRMHVFTEPAQPPTSSEYSEDSAISPPVTAIRIVENPTATEDKPQLAQALHTANGFETALSSTETEEQSKVTEPKQESPQTSSAHEFEVALVSRQAAKILNDQAEEIKQKNWPGASNDVLIDFSPEKETSVKTSTAPLGPPTPSIKTIPRDLDIVPSSVTQDPRIDCGPYTPGAMAELWSSSIHPFSTSQQPQRHHAMQPPPGFGYPTPVVPMPFSYHRPTPFHDASSAMGLYPSPLPGASEGFTRPAQPPPGFATAQSTTSQATFDALLDEDLYNSTPPKNRPQPATEHHANTTHTSSCNLNVTFDSLALEGQQLPVDSRNKDEQVDGLSITSAMESTSLLPSSPVENSMASSKLPPYYGPQTQLTNPDVGKALLTMRQVGSLNSMKEFSQNLKIPSPLTRLPEGSHAECPVQSDRDAKASEAQEFPPLGADKEAATESEVSNSNKSKKERKQKRTEAREALREAWCDRDEARMKVVGTWTFEGAQALIQANTAYIEKRDALKVLMPSGEFNEDDERMFPVFGDMDLMAPKYRPTGIADIKRRRAANGDKSDDSAGGNSASNTDSEGAPPSAHQSEIAALKEKLVTAQTLLRQAYNYFKQPRPQSNIKYETWKKKGDAQVERASKFYRMKREDLAAALPNGWTAELFDEFPDML